MSSKGQRSGGYTSVRRLFKGSGENPRAGWEVGSLRRINFGFPGVVVMDSCFVAAGKLSCLGGGGGIGSCFTGCNARSGGGAMSAVPRSKGGGASIAALVVIFAIRIAPVEL